MSTPPTLDGIGCQDAKLPCGSWARLPDDDVNVATELTASGSECFSLRRNLRLP